MGRRIQRQVMTMTTVTLEDAISNLGKAFTPMSHVTFYDDESGHVGVGIKEDEVIEYGFGSIAQFIDEVYRRINEA